MLGADERIVEREVGIFERPAPAGGRGGPARPGHGARHRGARRARGSCRDRGRRRNYTKPLMHDGDELMATDARHPVVERFAPDAFVPERRHARCWRAPAGHPDRAEHGRQVDLPAPDGPALPDGAGRLVRAGADGEAPGGRSPVRARRRLRQHRARPVHVHGGNAGDREHPALRDIAQPGDPRRDRPRHRDLRRPQPRVGGRGVPGVEPEGAAEDDLRDALPRAHRPRRCPAVASPTSTSSCASGKTTSSFCARSSRGGRIAATGSRWRGWRACPTAVVLARARDPERARARRALARRPSLAQRRGGREPAAARLVPGAAGGETIRCTGGCASWT